jgi:hypothetical protein
MTMSANVMPLVCTAQTGWLEGMANFVCLHMKMSFAILARFSCI